MRELFQVLDREDRISILKLLSLLIKESNKTTYNDNSDWILAFNEAGFRTDDININEILSNVDMDVYNVPLEDWQVQALNSICFLENILILDMFQTMNQRKLSISNEKQKPIVK